MGITKHFLDLRRLVFWKAAHEGGGGVPLSLVEARLVVASEQQVAGWQGQRLSHRPGSSPTTSLCVSTTSETAFPPSTPGVAQAPLSDITQMSDGDTGWH